MKLGIDVLTKDKNLLMSRLDALRTTLDVVDGGTYREDRHYSQIHLDTLWAESELDDWLWRTNQNYVGTFSREKS
jgi:hypothetical protein